MTRRVPFSVDEWYHCFNRGVEKRTVFENEIDANRFLMALFLANGTEPVGLHNVHKPELKKSLTEDRGKQIVSVGAYCLMPNHFHLLLKEITDGGITTFMQKLGTAYTMYFNVKYERVGNLFMRPFRARHVEDDRYFQKVLGYIHCNPAELYEPGWKSGNVRNMRLLREKLIKYPYSSLRSYETSLENPILSGDGFKIADQLPLPRMLDEARIYYAAVASANFER
ncbi:MAG: transposase [Candidatus Kaiserbacteria bacterium]|nr:transposase [Candidatus Kaiserbacteria bacterium]